MLSPVCDSQGMSCVYRVLFCYMSFIRLFGMLQLRRNELLWSPFVTLWLRRAGVLCDYYFVILGSFVFSCGSPKMAKWLYFALPAFSLTVQAG